MSVATPVFERCDDSSGTIIGIFDKACRDLGEIAQMCARLRPHTLAESIFNALQDNDYGQYDGLIAIMSPALGEDGLIHLKVLVEDLGRKPIPAPPEKQSDSVPWGMQSATYEHEMQERKRQRTVSTALKDIADAQGDVDGFIAQYTLETRKVPKIAAEIASRLLTAGRAEDALGFLEQAKIAEDRWIPQEWQDVRLEVLEALGRSDEAQAFRWSCFERDLSVKYLRAYLKQLPDFDDIEAEERAMEYAMTHSNLLASLQFFLAWPSLECAAKLLIQRHDEIDGNRYEYLVSAAEALHERHPLAATLALRAMIDFTLSKARSKRYGYAVQHLSTCADLASGIEDFGNFETHDAYVARLRSEHGRKHGFWSQINV